ncbi:MAG: hypothetical protein CVV44_06570 [Spirochaetae bacterium HGW-Spirochaetae-1]|jgi:hypothetical protein|nr:MAG: hypothetical protein CVV44_06570 [Spirochaetae bacterium HGW-Spirochaetae-1]
MLNISQEKIGFSDGEGTEHGCCSKGVRALYGQFFPKNAGKALTPVEKASSMLIKILFVLFSFDK